MTVTNLYRIANRLYKLRVPILPYIIYRLIYLFHNCHVYYKTEIGEKTKFAYGGIAVVIHKNAKIGKNCMIESCVTIGGRSNEAKVPVIGDNVFIGVGAKVLGNIHIGDNIVIGANAVVIGDVPSNSIVVGIPAKIIKSNIKVSEYCNLPEMSD
jgi:serine O-acetyltransferase